MSGTNQPRSGPRVRGRRLILGGLLIAALAVVAAGCGSSGPSTSTSTSGSLRTGPKNAVQTAFEYSRCMRSHGVTNWPDPGVDSLGRPSFPVTKAGISIDATRSPQMLSKIGDCQREPGAVLLR